MIRTAFIAAMALALAGCNATESRGADPIAAASESTATTATPSMHTGGTLPPRSVLDAAPNFNGLGPLRFGMDAQQMRKAWTQPLYGEPPQHDPSGCYYLHPRKDDYNLLLMMEGGNFVRVDVRKGSATAPGGGGLGMTIDEMRELYADRMEAMPNKYDSTAHTLRIAPLHGEPSRLVFETDAKGNVTSWRIGLPPQVDYVEGCS